MQIVIDHSSGRAVYQQIVDYVKREIALGRYRFGEQIPTVRDLAKQLVLNPNTIAKAYRILEQNGVITTRPGAGAFIADSESPLTAGAKEKILTEKLEYAIVEAVSLKVKKNVLTELFNRLLEKFHF